MKKIVKSILVSIFALFASVFFAFSFSRSAFAVDLTVTCDGTHCTMAPTSGAALFNENNWLPGDTVTRNLTVVNNATNDACDLVMNVDNPTQTPADFATKLWTVIKDGSTDLYGVRDGLDRATNNKTLNDLFLGDTVDYGVIAAGTTEAFAWTVTFDFLAGNEYQNAQTVFDFDLYFACGEPGENQPRLVLDKDNDRKGDVLGIDDVVTYEVTVRNFGPGTSYNTQVIDVQPIGAYFNYLEDSGLLTCTPPGGPATAITATDSNPYIWNLGTMDPGELCTLTYQLQIVSTNIPGVHNNIAMARGQDSQGGTVFSNTVVDPFEVGQPGGISAGYKGEVEVKQEGQVLGAATKVGQVLGAATGSPTFWLVLVLVLVASGGLLKLYGKLKIKN